MLAHAVRMGALRAWCRSSDGALVAWSVGRGILAPVARRWQMPSPPLGFASVVSMMPRCLPVRMASGLVQLADYSMANSTSCGATIARTPAAIANYSRMSFGVVAPKMIIDRFGGG